MEDLITSLPQGGPFAILGVSITAAFFLVRDLIADEAKQRLKPLVQRHFGTALLVLYVAFMFAIAGQLAQIYSAIAAATAAAGVALWRALGRQAAGSGPAIALQVALVLGVPVAIAAGHRLVDASPRVGDFLVSHSFDRIGRIPVDDQELLELSQKFRDTLAEVYSTSVAIRPDLFDDYRGNIYPNDTLNLSLQPKLRLENKVQAIGETEVILISKPTPFEDGGFRGFSDPETWIRSEKFDPDEAFLRYHFLKAAWQILKQVQTREHLRLSPAEALAVKRAIVGELQEFAGELEDSLEFVKFAVPVEELKQLRVAPEIPDGRLEELFGAYDQRFAEYDLQLAVAADEGGNGGLAQARILEALQ